MDKIRNQIKEKRTIKDNTLNAYMRNLKIMAKGITGEDFKNLNFLQDFNKVKKYLEDPEKTKTEATRKNRLATILVLLRLNEEKNEDIIDKYAEYLTDMSDKYYKKISENKKTAKQSENWVDYKKLVKVFNDYSRELRKRNLHKGDKKILSTKERDLLQRFLTTGLYILNEPRRNQDYIMRVVSGSDYDKLKDSEKLNNNYLVVYGRNKKMFSFGDFKTKKKYGVQKYPVPSKLNSVINIWLKYNKGKEWLLYNNRGQKMSSNSLTKYLQKIFNTTGKNNIGATMIRHIFASYNDDIKEYREAKEKAEKIAHKMGHSLNEQQNYVKKTK
jgi:hypothetical protein